MSPQQPPTTHCQKCGALLDQQLLGGVCQSCLWTGLLEDDDALGDRPEIPDHEVFEEIGHGGMGIVYRARQLKPEREVALKIIAPYSLRAAEARQRFLMEVEAMAAVEHPAVLPLYEIGEDAAGRPWLTMPLMSGGSLADVSEKYAGKWRDAALLIETLSRAIGFAHERGIIHRDLKPSNILFDGSNHPYIADFGLAKWAHAESGVTQSNYLLGSPSYLAPEAAAKGSKATTTVSDVYSLGAILYELLTGTKPYDGGSAAEILTQIINQPPPPPRKFSSKLPRDLEVIVLKAMSRGPEKRYHSALALAEDLDRWLNDRPIEARPVGPIERALGWGRRNPALATVSMLLLASLITGGSLLWRTNRDLTVALDDAEARVDYMTRELPGAIAPLGRLELLDGVFQDVAEHFDSNPRHDPETLARHADFLTQWAQILRPRGRITESIDRLHQGHRLALLSTKNNAHPSIEVVRARLSAGLLLGEALIEKGDIPEARRILTHTNTFAEKFHQQHGQDLRVQCLLAEISNELLIADLATEFPEIALESSKHARALWNQVKPRLLDGPPSSQNQNSLISAIRYPYFEAEVFAKLGQPETQIKVLQEYLNDARTLKKNSPENLLYLEEFVTANTSLANGFLDTGLGDPATIRTLMIEADDDAQRLAARDPGNIRWANNSVYTALVLARLAEKQQDSKDYTHWQTLAGNRVTPLYNTFTTHLAFLTAKRDAGIFALEHRVTRDWPWERPHFEGIIQVQIEIARLSPDPIYVLDVANLLERFAWQIHENESTEAAITWLDELATSLSHESGATPETEGYWRWLEAFSHARAAGYQKGTPPEKVTLEKSNVPLLKCLPGIPLLFNSKVTSDNEKLRITTTLLEAAASDTPRESNTALLKIVRDFSSQLPTEKQVEISRLISTITFPAEVISNPLFQELKALPRE